MNGPLAARRACIHALQRPARVRQVREQECQAVAHGRRHHHPASTHLAEEQAFMHAASGGRLAHLPSDSGAASERGRHVSAVSENHSHIENVESPNRVVQRPHGEAQLSCCSERPSAYPLDPWGEILSEDAAVAQQQKKRSLSTTWRATQSGAPAWPPALYLANSPPVPTESISGLLVPDANRRPAAHRRALPRQPAHHHA